ncbi:GNAT family N-acetyltransferase [Halobacillus sp. GSS1]|uniref:GNAT family N-acetyltransferase n=1 Tax=Halobacillus sp. GSS1 TaxID=2815919 RepID=UPI001A90855D|nr:GNAT family N-acetyltransferase [Halobacillus sp. GSS1]MBN9654041.1 GNAT family N-acetyltransferase [Halobacillus sp. GSS1]
MNDYLFTNRMERILQLANQMSKEGVITSVDLFIAACREATGVCSELYLYLFHHLGKDFELKILNQWRRNSGADFNYIGHYKISMDAVLILEESNKKRKNYGQTLINEGHMIQSILQSDAQLRFMLTEGVVDGVVNIACVPRDLFVNLDHFKKHYGSRISNHCIRRAAHSDLMGLKSFVIHEFGKRWLQHINAMTEKEVLPVYIAIYGEEIIGFACYDTVRNKKGLFGPMGTSHKKRRNAVGRDLLFKCLNEMAELGYEYAVIGEAGPIEFYEKACDAKLLQTF